MRFEKKEKKREGERKKEREEKRRLPFLPRRGSISFITAFKSRHENRARSDSFSQRKTVRLIIFSAYPGKIVLLRPPYLSAAYPRIPFTRGAANYARKTYSVFLVSSVAALSAFRSCLLPPSPQPPSPARNEQYL